jgi:hypothetical protein
MSKFVLLLLVMAALKQSAFGQDYWLPKDTVNGAPKSAATSFVIENRAYLVTGTDDFEYNRNVFLPR